MVKGTCPKCGKPGQISPVRRYGKNKEVIRIDTVCLHNDGIRFKTRTCNLGKRMTMEEFIQELNS